MTTTFLCSDIWPQLKDAARNARVRCAAAVAYFGTGASNLLPLAKGSRLVVDASDGAVKSGQTCPAELQKMVKRGVAVYSVPNLHAKVFVLGRTAFIGSTNASNRSAAQLVEAVIRTTDEGTVEDARHFVTDLCIHELTPTLLDQLTKIYRPPQIPGGNRGLRSVKSTFRRPTLPRLLLAQLHREDWSEREYSLYDAGMPIARKRREHPRAFQLDAFVVSGKCPYRRGDVVIQVTDEGSAGKLMSPPGNVLHVRSGRDGTRNRTVVYVERPSRRRRALKSVAQALGRGAHKLLNRDGVVREAKSAQTLLNAWAVSR